MEKTQNPMNDKETRTGFIKLGFSCAQIRDIYNMFRDPAEYFKNVKGHKCQE